MRETTIAAPAMFFLSILLLTTGCNEADRKVETVNNGDVVHADDTDAGGEASSRDLKVISMTDEPPAFNPGFIQITEGQTIEWRNNGNMDHTVTADPRMTKNHGWVELPKGAQAFNSGDIQGGGTYRHTFTTPGTYKYFCKYHAEKGMVGEVEVQPKQPK